MAIVALVLSGISLVAVVGTQLLPPLIFAAFGGLGPGGFLPGPNAVGAFSGNTYQGAVAVAKDGTVAGDVLATAVEAAVQGDLLGAVSCDPTPKAVTGVSVLCRNAQTDQISSYAVVQFTNDTGHFQAMTFTYGAPGANP
jgi:hypothetical protein